MILKAAEHVLYLGLLGSAAEDSCKNIHGDCSGPCPYVNWKKKKKL